MKYYSVAVPVPVYRLFDYSFPEKIQPGSRVRVQFGNTEKIGYVIEELKTGASVEDPREITQIIDPEPLINKSLIKLGKKLSEYYISPLGEIMKSILPVSVKLPSRKLKERPCILPTKSDFILSNEQESVLKAIKKRLKKGEAGEVLIHGATASGKTEIYMHIAQSLIDSGFQMLILVPEIAITAQIVRRFEERFGTRSIAIWHSRMTPVRRGQTINRLRSGDADILIGTRSSVFAPFNKLGAIVIDEEHDQTYKEENPPYYDARTVAGFRSEIEKALLILSTATPRMESMHRARQGEIELLEIKEKISGTAATQIEVVDMREERRGFFFSRRLLSSMEETLDRRAQIILLINRRGYAPFVICKNCGENIKCHNCSAGLVYHQSRNLLLCHSCGRETAPPSNCPECSGKIFRYSGAGTQRVISALGKIFPDEKVLRLDSDQVAESGADEIYNKFTSGKYSIMVGTKLVAKGWDFPNVELVGVINAEMGLMYPDFRAPERLYDLLVQISGRAGRGNRPGRMVLQSMNPTHYAIRELLSGEYMSFYNKEISIREEAGFPPFSRLVKITASRTSRATAFKRLKLVSDKLSEIDGVFLMGPVESGGFSRRGKSYHLIVKDTLGKGKVRLAELATEGRLRGLRIDIDPEEMI